MIEFISLLLPPRGPGHAIAIKPERLLMSTQHTPGPWMVRHDFLCSDGTFTVGVAAVKIGSGSGAVAWPTGTNEAQELANARLIAAAPDLLDALKLALRQNEHDVVMTGEECRQCFAAIAKATGEQQ